MNSSVLTPHPAYMLLVHECPHCFASEHSTHANESESQPAGTDPERLVCLCRPRSSHSGQSYWAGQVQRCHPLQEEPHGREHFDCKTLLKWFLKKGYWNLKNQPLSFGHYVSKPRLFPICFPVCVFRLEDTFHYCHSRKFHWSEEQSRCFLCYWAHTLLVCKCQIILNLFISILRIQQLDIIIVMSFFKYVGTI